MLTPIQMLDKLVVTNERRPVVMLSLLRFHHNGGRERYADYLAIATPIVARFGAEILFVGDGLPALSVESGQA